MNKVDLSSYQNTDYKPGNKLKLLLWYMTNVWFFKSSFLWPSFIKISLLKLFGAKVGKGITIKPNVNIKYPWFLEIGDHVWIGEEVWVDNLAQVSIGSNACLSQGAMLLCGNHNYKTSSFDLIVKPIVIEEGVWIGARSTVCPGVTVRSHAVLSVGALANKDLEAYKIYQGVPAKVLRNREIN